MRKIDLVAACVAFVGAASVLGPQRASATDFSPELKEAVWGYCCTAARMKCCSRGGCEIDASGCVRL
jgi:hypothetical protein